MREEWQIRAKIEKLSAVRMQGSIRMYNISAPGKDASPRNTRTSCILSTNESSRLRISVRAVQVSANLQGVS